MASGAIPFGFKNGWFAIKTTDSGAVVKALGLSEPREADWETGIEASYTGTSSVFVTRVERWTLVVGFWTASLGSHDPTRKTVEQTIVKLSQQFGEAQAFFTHRVTECHCWTLARDGTLVRSFGYTGDSGELFANFGEPTEAERGFDLQKITRLAELLKRDSEGEEVGEELDALLAEEVWSPSESDVMAVAASWSLDPTRLDASTDCDSTGLLAWTSVRPQTFWSKVFGRV